MKEVHVQFMSPLPLPLGLVCELVDIPHTHSILQDNKQSDDRVDASQFFKTQPEGSAAHRDKETT